MQYDGIIFDLDGTLVHTAPDLLRATNHVLKKVNLPPVPMKAIQEGISFGAIRMMQDALKYSDAKDDHFAPKDLLPDFLTYYNDHIAVDSHIFDRGFDLLNQCKRNDFPVGVCTNKSIGLATHLLDQLEITPYLAATTGGDSFDFKKPDPRHIEKTRDLMGLSDSDKLLMVGDSRNDIKAAQNAGWDSVIVSFGYSEDLIETLGATYQIDSLMDLASIIGFQAP